MPPYQQYKDRWYNITVTDSIISKLLFLVILVHHVHRLIPRQRPSLSPVLTTIWFMHDTSSDGDRWLCRMVQGKPKVCPFWDCSNVGAYNFQRRPMTIFKPKVPGFGHTSVRTSPKKRWDVSRMHTLRWKVSRRGPVATTIEEFSLQHIWQLEIYPCGSQVPLIQIIVVPYLILRCLGAYQLMNYLWIYTFSRLKEKQDENSLFSVLQRKVTLCSSKKFDNWRWYLG